MKTTEDRKNVQPEPAKAPQAEVDAEIIFYCKDCADIVDTNRCGKKYVYKCKKCGTKNVAFGSKKSIYNFFHIEERIAAEKRAKMREELEKKRRK